MSLVIVESNLSATMTKNRKQNRERSPKMSDETKKLTIAQKLQSMSNINLETQLQTLQGLLSPKTSQEAFKNPMTLLRSNFK